MLEQPPAPLTAWHQRKSRDRNLDVFDKALIRFERRGKSTTAGRVILQQKQTSRQVQQQQQQEAFQGSFSGRNQLGEIDEDSANDDMSRTYEQYSRNVTTSSRGGGTSGIGVSLLPRRTNSIGSEVWGRSVGIGGSGVSGSGVGGSGFRRQEVFRRSFRQAPVNVGGTSRSTVYSTSFSGGGSGGGASGLVRRISVTDATRAASSGGRAASAYFSEGVVINPGTTAAVPQHQLEQHHEEQLLQRASVGSVERELLGYRQQDSGGVGGVVTSRYRQVAATTSPENVHSEGFLIQRRSIGQWQSGAARGGGMTASGEHHLQLQHQHQLEQQQQLQQLEHQQRLQQMEYQQRLAMLRQEKQHQLQQQQHIERHVVGDYPVLRVHQPYKMNFVMSKEAPAAYGTAAAASDAATAQFVNELYSNRRVSGGGGRQSVMGYGDAGGGGSSYQQQRQVVYLSNQQQLRAESPRAFAPYQASTAQTQTTLTRSVVDGHGTIKEGTIHKHQAAGKSEARQQELEAMLSRLEISNQAQADATKTASATTKTTTTTTNVEQKQGHEAAAAATAAAAHSQRKQSTVSRVSVQNEAREEEATYFMDGDRVRKRVKRRRYLDGKLVDEKEEVESLTEEERKQVNSQRQQWQWKSTTANGHQAAESSGGVITTTHSTTAGGVVTSTSAKPVRPKKRACACCYPRHRRYKAPAGTATTTTTTTTTAAAAGPKTMRKQSKATKSSSGHPSQPHNGRAGNKQVAFDEQHAVYN